MRYVNKKKKSASPKAAKEKEAGSEKSKPDNEEDEDVHIDEQCYENTAFIGESV